MAINNAHAVYFSPNHTTQRIARAVADGSGLSRNEYDITRLSAAPAIPAFGREDLVILGLPVYAGRVPAPAAERLKTLRGNGAPCILVGVYGNRAFDDFLVELEDIAKAQGLRPVAAGAFIAEHCITDKLGTGRPDGNDLALAEKLGRDVVAKLNASADVPELPFGAIPGRRPYQTYAASKSGKVNPIKVANGPTVGDACTNCKQCVGVCPIDNINPENVHDINPFDCLRCSACVHACPAGAISFQKPQFLAHIKDLEAKYTEPKQPLVIL